jgi:hypothetical protein
MTTASRRLIEAMQALAGQDLEQTSDERVRVEFVEDGRSPDAEAGRAAERLDAIVAQFMRDRAAAAKALRAATTPQAPRRRPILARMRALVQAALDREPRLSAEFRAGDRQLDRDVRQLYDDLVAMGKIGRRDK